MTHPWEQHRPYVIVRSRDEGVRCGYLVHRVGRDVYLEESRRIRAWQGALGLEGVSQYGVDPQKSRLTTVVPRVIMHEACTTLFCSAAAREILINRKFT